MFGDAEPRALARCRRRDVVLQIWNNHCVFAPQPNGGNVPAWRYERLISKRILRPFNRDTLDQRFAGIGGFRQLGRRPA